MRNGAPKRSASPSSWRSPGSFHLDPARRKLMEFARQNSGYRPGSRRESAVSSLLSAAIIVIAALLAIYQSGVIPPFEHGRSLVAFDVSPAGSSRKADMPVPRQQAAKTRQEPEHKAKLPHPKLVIANPQAPKSDDFGVPGFIHLTRAEMAKGDIGKVRGKALAGAAGGAGSGDQAAPGDGPGGERLYNPDWFRKPTDTELATYLPKHNPGDGWGAIACRTIENHRVEDCQILGESPGGSGYGRAALNAAWQFQVIPPRINAKPQLGVWVRIKIEYTQRGSRAG
jgi:hypothetical protein